MHFPWYEWNSMRRWSRPLAALALVCLAFVACAEEKGTGGTWLDPEHGDNAGRASGLSCEFNGKTYEAGESYRADCNRCTCQGGGWKCTLILCPGDGGAAGANGGEAGAGGVGGEGGAAATTSEGGAGG